MALDLLGCMHTHLQGYTEMYKNRSTVKEVGGQWGIGQKERLPIEEGGGTDWVLGKAPSWPPSMSWDFLADRCAGSSYYHQEPCWVGGAVFFTCSVHVQWLLSSLFLQRCSRCCLVILAAWQADSVGCPFEQREGAAGECISCELGREGERTSIHKHGTKALLCPWNTGDKVLCLPWLTGLLWGSNDVMAQGARWHLLCTRQTKRISI